MKGKRITRHSQRVVESRPSVTRSRHSAARNELPTLNNFNLYAVQCSMPLYKLNDMLMKSIGSAADAISISTKMLLSNYRSITMPYIHLHHIFFSAHINAQYKDNRKENVMDRGNINGTTGLNIYKKNLNCVILE